MTQDIDDFDVYPNHLAQALGHADRHAGLKGYCSGLVLPLTRKKRRAPMAGHIDPLHASARHRSLRHFVAKAEWSDKAAMQRVFEWVMPALSAYAADEPGYYWIIDAAGFPKKGRHSVGVAHQYCGGQLGKRDNRQVGREPVRRDATRQPSSCMAALIIPKEWIEDRERAARAGIPDELDFATKPQIALTQLREALASGITPGIVLADAGYGDETAFRDGVTELGLLYSVGVRPGTSVREPGKAPLAPKPWSGPREASDIVAPGARIRAASAQGNWQCNYQATAWQSVTGRKGSNAALSSRFAAVRVRPAHRDYWRSTVRDEEWLLIEWPDGNSEPLKYFLTTAPEEATLEQLVYATKMRWRIERDYQDLKQEFGLGHYEGRGWRGFHHHPTLSIAAYGFLMAQRLRMGSNPGNKKTSPNARCLSFPRTTSLAAVQRAPRHVPDSITTLRVLLGIRLLHSLLDTGE